MTTHLGRRRPERAGKRLHRRASVVVAFAALPLVLGACPDAPRAPDSDLRISPGARPARVERAAVLLEPATDAPAGGLRGAVVFDETTVTAQDGTSVVTLAARYRVFGLTGPSGTDYRLRVEPAERCAGPTADGGIVLGKEDRPVDETEDGRLVPVGGEAEGRYDRLQDQGLTLAGKIVGHAVTVIDGNGAVLLCGVARRSSDEAHAARAREVAPARAP